MIQKKQSKEAKNKKGTHIRVNFTLPAPEAHSVLLVGDFNNWNTYSHLLKKYSNGRWKTSISLEPGRYEYRFVVDGVWQNDPQCTAFTPNPFGSTNCVLLVS
jgi:1,4-alpha-glucan branching enzyme